MKAALLSLLLLTVGSAEAAPSKEDEHEARERYERGMAKYTLRDFDGAIDDFKAAYSLTREPGLLFNLAQANRLARRSEEALYFYRAYLRQYPDAPNRGDAELFIDRLAAEAAPAVAATPRPAVAPRLSHHAAREEHPHPNGRLELGLGIAFGGTALALLGGALALGNAANDASAHIGESATRGAVFTPQLRAQWNDGQREAAGATALYVVSAAAAVAGVTLTVIGARRVWRARFAAAPLPGGAQMAWSCAF